jgi:hypothetical protein
VPILLDTAGKNINALQVKINVAGDVSDLELVTSSELPLQALINEVATNQAMISLTHEELGESWSTEGDVAVFYLKFKTAESGDVQLSFDRSETMAGYVDSEQKIAIGDDLALSISSEAAVAELAPADSDAMPIEMTGQAGLAETQSTPTTNYILTAAAALSIIAALLILFFNFRKGKDESDSNPPVQF